MTTELILPTHFFVNRQRWTVELVDHIEPGANEGKVYGICDSEERRIEILDSLGAYMMLRTFVHEYLHAVEFAYKIKIPHKMIYFLERPIARLILLFVRAPRRLVVRSER